MSDQPNPNTTPTPTPPSSQSLDEILNQLEKTTGTMPNVAVTEPVTATAPTTETPAVPETTAQPAMAEVTTSAQTETVPASESQPPVATIPENNIPTPAPVEPIPPAEMVKENPGIDTATSPATTEVAPEPIPSTPEPTPVETTPVATEAVPEPVQETPSPSPEAIPSMPTPTETTPAVDQDVKPAEVPVKKSGSGGKIVAGILGVLLLAGAAGAGIFLTQQPQETRTPAVTTTTTTAETEAPAAPQGGEVVTGSDLANQAVLISGKACLNEGMTTGNIFITNTDQKFTTRIYIAQGVSTYSTRVPIGTYVVYYKTSDAKQIAGYTDTVHNLQPIRAEKEGTFTADACDVEVNTKSIPELGYVITAD